MPSVLASPSPIRRYGGNAYSNYTSSSAYSRSSTSYGGRTSSLDRSSYSSYVSSYKYGSGATSGTSTKDYTSRPPIGSSSFRNTTVAPSSIYSSSRLSPARSYLSRKSASIEDGGSSSGSTTSLRNRETQSESREGNNNTYTNGNVRRGVRDYSVYSPTSSSTTSTLSKYRTADRTAPSNTSSGTTRSKYGDYSDTKTEVAKVGDRNRGYQSSSREPVFKSRFLRSTQDSATNQPAKEEKNAATDENAAEEEARPSVAELRRRYDVNRNDVTTGGKEPPAAQTAKATKARTPSESESDDESDRDTIRSSRTPEKPPPPPPLPPPPTSSPASKTAPRVRNSSTSDRGTSNGGLDVPVETYRIRNKSEAAEEKKIDLDLKDRARSSSPSTLSSSSDGETQDHVGSGASPVADRRSTLPRSRATATSTTTSGRGTTVSRSSISDSDSESLSKSPKLSANRRNKVSALAPAPTPSTTQNLERQGLVGFRNIGNTCFMNSVLQCLSNTRSVLEYVLSEEYVNNINTSISSMNGALIKAFASVISELWKQEDDEYLSGAVNPTALKTQIQKFAPRFMGYNQQDSQEFLRYLLEGLHEDVNRVSVKPKPLEHDIDDNLSDAQKAAESWKRYLRRDDSKIVDLFVGQLKSTLQCTVCGHCSVTFDPFWDLSLPIPSSSRSIKVQHCLDLFAKEEILDGDEKPTCSKCQARRKCTKAFSIQKFPQILVLRSNLPDLKRFSPGERFRKLDANVDFPLAELDLSAYSAPGLKPTPCTYQLYGVINHSGTAYSGHYTAFCRHPFSNTWHEYNDSRVTNLSPQRIVSSEAYLLFYEMESHEARL